MIGSDSQAMGRVGETIIRTWQTAHAMKLRRGRAPGDGGRRDNLRASATSPSTRSARRSPTGSTPSSARSRSASSPTSCSGIPRSSAVRPDLVLKGGAVAWAPIGDANASIPTPQPVFRRPMFAAAARAAGRHSVSFVAPAALEAGLAERLGLTRELRRRRRYPRRSARPTCRSTTPCRKSASTLRGVHRDGSTAS